MELNYKSIAQLVEAAEAAGQNISDLVLCQQAGELGLPAEQVYQQMAERYHVMAESVQAGIHSGLKSTSGLTGGDAYRIWQARQNGPTLCGSILSGAITRALAISEYNAAMGRIVAAPTAGSCGILPAALLTMQADHHKSERRCVMALFTAGAVGMVIAANASVAGAEGGCQAECGSAAAMAAAALVELSEGTPRMAGNAVALALKSTMGLVCDPVAGLVEIPCIKRNASGVMGAFTAAEMARAGIESAIPADEVIWAMKQVGNAMSSTLKETAQGGLAATPTAQKLYQQVFGCEGSSNGCAGCGACR